MEETINRYGRQELIEGWNQEALTDARIGIVGSGHIANFTAGSLAALGVGDIRIYDDSRVDYQISGTEERKKEFLLANARENSSKVESLEKKLSRINPLIKVLGIHMSLDRVSEYLINGFRADSKLSDLGDYMHLDNLIITTNNLAEAINYIKFAEGNRIPYYFAGCDENIGFFSSEEPAYNILQSFSRKKQDAISAEVISGLLVGEILAKRMRKDSVSKMVYSPADENRFLNEIEDSKSIREGLLKDKSALVVGAGALGNFLGIGLAHAGIGKMYLIDDDTIETTNLNRQILFYESVGKLKADVLAERLNEINPFMSITPVKRRVSEDFEEQIRKIKPDVLIDCVDNLGTRAILNHFAVKYRIPFISGGTDYQSGQVAVYEPGKSSCLDCRLGVNQALVRERSSHSCIYAPNPSVVVTNHIIGGLMAAEARCVLDSESYGSAVRKSIKYDSSKGKRIGLVGTDNSCSCKTRTKTKTWIDGLMKKTG